MADLSPKPLDTDIDLWEQQTDEGEQAFGAFTRYRNIPRAERTLQKVAGELDKSVTLMSRWSSQWSWRPRVMEWDRAQERKDVEAQWEKISAMKSRHAGQAVAQGQVLMAPVMALHKLMRERPDAFFDYFTIGTEDGGYIIDFDRMDRVVSMAMQAARIMPTVTGMEREARGIPADALVEEANPRSAALQFMGTAEARQKAQELFATVNGHSLPALPAGVMQPRDDDG